MKLYTIYDETSESYAPPFLAKNDDTAIREFQRFLVKNIDVQNQHEYMLHRIGMFDAESGHIEVEERTLIEHGLDYIALEKLTLMSNNHMKEINDTWNKMLQHVHTLEKNIQEVKNDPLIKRKRKRRK